MFKMATGWLGWSPEVALSTPIPQIELALEGRAEWANKTSPFGSAEPVAPDQKPDVAAKLKAALRGRR